MTRPPSDDDPTEPRPRAGDGPADGRERGATSGGTSHAALAEGPGTSIGPYRLLEILGEGGFGTVWLAERREPMVQRVALKIIKPGMDSREVIARFDRERQALALMSHAAIARVFDAGTTSGELGFRPYFVMELARGERLTAWADRHRLSPNDRVALLARVADAVDHAHRLGIVHRDLKPGNILAADAEPGTPAPADGSADRAVVKVIDFGIAKALQPGLTDKTLHTEHGRLIGTPEYMSPEQAGGDDAPVVDKRADVYALGVILYELLAGVTPRDLRAERSKGYAEVQRTIREREPPAAARRYAGLDPPDQARIACARGLEPADLRRVLRGEVSWIIAKAMSVEPARRYAGAADFAADLRRFLDGRAIGAAPASVAYRARSAVRRSAGARGCVAIALAAGTLTGWVVAALAAPLGLGAGQVAVQWAVQEVENRFDLFDIGPDLMAHTRIVRLTGLTDVPALAAREFPRAGGDHPPPPGSDDRTAWLPTLRLLHGRLLDRLAVAGARAVLFDIQFASRSEFDQFLAQRADQWSGSAVIFAAQGWGGGLWPGEVPDGPAAPRTAGPARVGGVTINRDPDTNHIDAEIAVLRAPRGARTPPVGLGSIALEGFAAWMTARPAATRTLAARGDQRLALDLAGLRSPVLVFTSGILADEAGRADLGILPGDRVAYLPILLPPDSALDAASTEYAGVFDLSAAELRGAFAGRIVVVGDATDPADRHPYADGRTVPGYALHAQAAEALVRAFGWRERGWSDAFLALLAAALGLTGWRLRGRVVRPLVLLAAVAGIGITSGVLLHGFSTMTNPIGAGIGMLVAVAIAAWLGYPERHATRRPEPTP